MRITGIAQPHRAFRQSADAKLTVPQIQCPSDPLHASRRGIERGSHGVDLILAKRATRKA